METPYSSRAVYLDADPDVNLAHVVLSYHVIYVYFKSTDTLKNVFSSEQLPVLSPGTLQILGGSLNPKSPRVSHNTQGVITKTTGKRLKHN